MRRSEMVTILEEEFKDVDINADTFLTNLEAVYGMTPPCLPSDHCQAIMHVYYAGYTFHMWEEDFEKDPKLVEALAKRREIAALTPEQRIARRKTFAELRRRKR